MSTVRLSKRASQLARKGRPWFFADDLDGALPEAAGLVRVATDRGRDLGLAFYSAQSKIRVRLCGTWPGDGVPLPEEFYRQRLEAAVAERAALRAPSAGLRLVHGEADGLPGLVVDQYADCLVVQVTAAAVEQSYDCIVPALVEITEARCVVARNDVAVRKLEGLPLEVQLLHGRRVEEVEIDENGLRYPVRLLDGQKTGMYLDQRRARARVRELAAGRSALDLFSYQGGFSLSALAGGATQVLAVDQSQPALDLAQRAAEANGLRGLQVRKGNAFDVLRDLRTAGSQFGLVVVDPPAFAKSRREVTGALRGYRDLNRNALRLLAPGGILVTCSCSHHLTGPKFEEVLRQAATELPFRVYLDERIGAGSDHPVWVHLPESEYLKVCVLRRPEKW